MAIILGSTALGVLIVIRALSLQLVSIITLIAMLGGSLVPPLPFQGWLAGVILALFGSEITLVRVGQLEAKIFVIMRTLFELTMQFMQRKNILPSLISLENGSGKLLGVVAVLLIRLEHGMVTLTAGLPAYDPIVSALIWSDAFWAIAVWGAWGWRRREQSLSRCYLGVLCCQSFQDTRTAMQIIKFHTSPPR